MFFTQSFTAQTKNAFDEQYAETWDFVELQRDPNSEENKALVKMYEFLSVINP